MRFVGAVGTETERAEERVVQVAFVFEQLLVVEGAVEAFLKLLGACGVRGFCQFQDYAVYEQV